MRFEHRFTCFLFSSLGTVDFLFHFLAFRGQGTVGADVENLVQSESGKKVAAALATMYDVKMSLPDFLQTQRDRRQRPHECGIHHRAILEVNYKLAVTAVDHFLREFFEAPAVEEVALPLHSNPNGGTVYAH